MKFIIQIRKKTLKSLVKLPHGIREKFQKLVQDMEEKGRTSTGGPTMVSWKRIDTIVICPKGGWHVGHMKKEP